MKVLFHREADNEFHDQIQWYSFKKDGLGTEFFKEVWQAIDLIIQQPELSPAYLQEYRRFVLKRFPYNVVYKKIGQVIRILAIEASSKKPGYWLTRVK